MVSFLFVKDTYVHEFVSKHGKEPCVDSELDCAAWIDASGGPSKGRVYGFGNMYRAHETNQTHPSSASSSLTYPQIDEDALKKAVDEAMAKQREELLAEVNRREEAAKKREDETKNMVEQMSKQKQEVEELLQQMKKEMEKKKSSK